MATGGKTDVDKARSSVVRCTLCSRKYRRPKTLPCSHTFCEECLQTRVGSSSFVRCPSCGTVVDLPPGGVGGLKSGPMDEEHLYKILVIGDIYTGKTSIINRYASETSGRGTEFEYSATVRLEFTTKDLRWDDNTIIQLHLWDIPGQDRFCFLARALYKGTDGVFVVFDASKAHTLDAALKWKDELDSKAQLPDGSPIPCILLANKCDLAKEGLVNYPSKMDDFCKRKGFIGWYETSAIEDHVNIDKAAKFLIARMLVNERALLQKVDTKHDTGDTVVLSQPAPNQAPKKKWRCRCQ